jgi:hypothetical protein
VSYISSIIIDRDFFGKGIARKRNISWLNRVRFVGLKIKGGGGLGVHDLEVKNSALQGKWFFKLLTEDGVWQTLLKRKYIGSNALSQVLWKLEDSYFLAGLMATKKFFLRYGTFSIKDGSQICFLKDSWLGNCPLSEQYPALYSIVRRKSDTIAVVMATSPPDVNFRRDLIGP